MTKEEYAAYRQSSHWRAFSSMMRNEVGACEECGITDTLNVHHRHYRSLYHEEPADVQVLCQRCHTNTHILESRIKSFGIRMVEGKTFVEKRNDVQKQIEEQRRSSRANKFLRW